MADLDLARTAAHVYLTRLAWNYAVDANDDGLERAVRDAAIQDGITDPVQLGEIGQQAYEELREWSIGTGQLTVHWEPKQDDAARIELLERELAKYRDELAGRDRELASVRDRLHAALYPEQVA